jgi:hypothetical protein
VLIVSKKLKTSIMRKTKNHEREISQVRKRMYHYGTTLMAVSILVVGVFLSGCTKAYIDMTSPDETLTAAGIEEIFPANFAESVEINPVIGVAFKPGTDPSKIAASSLTLKTGDVVIPGKVAVSGTMAMFTYGDNLSPNTEYTATIQTISTKGSAQDGSFEYSWKFKTGKDHRDNSLSVVSVNPPNLAKDVPVSTSLTIKVNKEVKSWMKNLISVILKTGSTPVAGSLSFSGNDVTFDPSVDLTPGTIFTCEFIYGIQGQNNDNHDGDDDSENDADDDNDKGNFGNSYTWSFTTAGSGNAGNIDTAPPTIISVNPASNSSSAAVNSNVTVTFSEAMNSATITSSTFGLKQGTTVISGTVTYSGNIATFAPSASLTGGAAYTATVTNGVKDAAGNALAANYTWNFATIAAATGLSFAGDVVPVLTLCNNCHTHPWTTSSVASTYYTNLVNGGYVNPTAHTSSKIYVMLNNGHASSISAANRNKILTWMNEGSKNN